jgi:rhamnogalacturonyl hydrolase YesR
MLNCSYGNGYLLTGNENYKKVLIEGSNSLMTRFHPNVGLIKSWDGRKEWQYPVIIDNILNLEMLCEVSKMTGDNTYKKVAISHANKTLENHFRADNSCFHVVNYDSISGKVISKETHQGFSNSSAWARGQGWALYGFTMMYRETKDTKYLTQARKVADYILNNPNLPKDKVPYWDFNAPTIPNEPRDASSAAIYASALIELSSYVKEKNNYFKSAETILKSLSSNEYLASKGENGLFILKHSVGNLPAKKEIDVPLNYADYYFIEALGRYMKAKGITMN